MRGGVASLAALLLLTVPVAAQAEGADRSRCSMPEGAKKKAREPARGDRRASKRVAAAVPPPPAPLQPLTPKRPSEAQRWVPGLH